MRHALTLGLMLTVASMGLASQTLEHDVLDGEQGPIAIHPISHASFVMESVGAVIYVDPVGGADEYQAFDKADLVLITHTHGDHLDLETLRGIVTSSTTLVTPASVAKKLGDALEVTTEVLANGESYRWKDVLIEAVPMYNLTEERQHFHPEGVGNGYVLTIGGKRVYIAGDTEGIPEMRALKDIDAAFVCMNLPYTMDVEHAADAVLEFAPKIVYPYHYRGKGGMSDISEFQRLVGANPKIEVRFLDWY